MATKKKILYIHHAKGWGGAPKSLVTLIENLDHSRFEFEVLLIFDSDLKLKFKERNIPFRVVDNLFYRRFYKCFVHSEAEHLSRLNFFRQVEFWVLWLLSRFFFARRELRKHDFDICHLNSSVLTDWLAPASMFGKVIIHLREPFKNVNFGFRTWVFRREVARYADSIIAISNDNAVRMGLPDKTVVVYNQAEVAKEEPSISSYKSKKILYLGGNLHIKGFKVIVEALQYLDSDVKVLFAGDYSISETTHIKKFMKSIFGRGTIDDEILIQQLKNNPKVTLLGMVSDVSQLMEDISCVLVPFVKPHFPRVVIEAYLNYKTVIASRVSGMSEVVIHNVTGVLVKSENPEELASAINEMVNNPFCLREMGQRGFDFAKSRFTQDNVQIIEGLYLKVLF